MSRLTKKLDEGFYVSNAPCTDDLKNKLGKLEDLEDELGCPLEVVFKALESFYCPELEKNKKLYSYYVYGFDDCELFVYLSYSKYDYDNDEEIKIPIKDYGVNWWLKGDRSE